MNKRTKVVVGSIVIHGLWACSSGSDALDRSGKSSGGGGDGHSSLGPVDPNGGRDDAKASCFAACQSTAFTCQTKSGSTVTVTTADLLLNDVGCAGKLTPESGEGAVDLKVDCVARAVCVGASPGQAPTACSPATFSAFSFAYTPEGVAMNVCTRD